MFGCFEPEFRNGITTKIAKNTKRRHLHRKGCVRNRPPGMLTKPLSFFVFSAFFVVNFGIRVKGQGTPSDLTFNHEETVRPSPDERPFRCPR